jgi:hypothetical protein
MTPARFFICDDSGSMMSSDGHRLIGEGNTSKLISCSRWTELTETLKFHVGLAKSANAPTEFRLLNGASSIFIGQDPESDANNVPTLTALLNGSPGGGTPLCFHLKEVIEQIRAIAPQLRNAGIYIIYVYIYKYIHIYMYIYMYVYIHLYIIIYI